MVWDRFQVNISYANLYTAGKVLPLLFLQSTTKVLHMWAAKKSKSWLFPVMHDLGVTTTPYLKNPYQTIFQGVGRVAHVKSCLRPKFGCWVEYTLEYSVLHSDMAVWRNLLSNLHQLMLNCLHLTGWRSNLLDGNSESSVWGRVLMFCVS